MFLSLIEARHGHESGNIHYQRHPAVTENSGTGHPGHFGVVVFQTLDHHLLLRQQLIDQQADFWLLLSTTITSPSLTSLAEPGD